MQKRSAVFWAMTLAELALVVYAVTSFAWAQPLGADNEPNLASATQARTGPL
jgi:hypothetical protein